MAVITAHYTVGPVLQDCFLHDAALGHFYDLNVYQAGGRAVLDGTALYDSSFPVQGMTLPFTYPPLAALLFSLLSWVPFRLLAVLATTASIDMTWLCAALIVRALLQQTRDAPLIDAARIALILTPAILLATICSSTPPSPGSHQYG